VLRFDPFSDLETLTRSVQTSQSGSARNPRFMPMDLCKIDDHFVLTADLPGVDPGSVDVTTDNGTLTVTARRSAPSDDSAQWLTNERFFGTYRRQISLGDGVDVARIAATYDNGVLTVSIPVAEAVKPRRVEVTHGGSAQAIRPTTVDVD
jgi:HSP20 family protein